MVVHHHPDDGYATATCTSITVAGRILAGLMAVLGIGLFALPAGKPTASGFVDDTATGIECVLIAANCYRGDT